MRSPTRGGGMGSAADDRLPIQTANTSDTTTRRHRPRDRFDPDRSSPRRFGVLVTVAFYLTRNVWLLICTSSMFSVIRRIMSGVL